MGGGVRFQDFLWTPEPRDAQVPTQNGRAQQSWPMLWLPTPNQPLSREYAETNYSHDLFIPPCLWQVLLVSKLILVAEELGT